MQVGKYEIDAQRTVELSLSGTLVESGKGDPDHFFCVPLSVVNQSVCPKCGCTSLRNQGSIRRSYLDVIPRGDDAAVITVTIEFRKNKCMNPDCNCVFYPEIPFAGRYSRTTHRLENAIVRMVIRGCLEIPQSVDMKEIARVLEQNGFIRMSSEAKRISLNKGYTENGFADKVYHIHLRYTGDNDELYFRDYLNEHPDAAKEYETLKLRLWKQYEHDRDAYTDAKTDFISKWTAESRKEYGDRY